VGLDRGKGRERGKLAEVWEEDSGKGGVITK